MIDVLIQLLVLVLVFGLVWWIVTLLPLPEPFKRIAQVVVAVIFLLIVLGLFFGGTSMPFLRR